MGGIGLIFTPVLVRRLLGHPGQPHPLPPAHPLICAIHDITVASGDSCEKSCSKSSSVS